MSSVKENQYSNLEQPLYYITLQVVVEHMPASGGFDGIIKVMTTVVVAKGTQLCAKN